MRCRFKGISTPFKTRLSHSSAFDRLLVMSCQQETRGRVCDSNPSIFFFYLEYFPIPPSRRGPTHRQRGKYFHCPSLTSAERSDDRVTLDYILSLSVDRRAIWTFGSYFFLAGQYPLFDDLKWRTVPLRRRRQERTDSRWFHWM